MDKKIIELADKFDDLTINKKMKILSYHVSNSKHIYYKEIMEEFEKNLIIALLKKYDHNITKVSAKIKLHRNTIQKKMKKFNIKEKPQKSKN